MTTIPHPPRHRAPLSDSIITAVAQLVDDAQNARRDPSHGDIAFEINRWGLAAGDPRAQGQIIGKAKRVRAVLSWSLENDPDAGETFVATLIECIKGYGGFRPTSQNYVGAEAIQNIKDAFRTEGYLLSEDGELQSILLDNLSGVELTDALQRYVTRAQRGFGDAALVTGTGKDLLEATAGHILNQRFGNYNPTSHFPTLLGQAFNALGLATLKPTQQSNEPPLQHVERTMYELGCAINRLRNTEGTGHGRPWLPSVTEAQAKCAVEAMGTIADMLPKAQKGVW